MPLDFYFYPISAPCRAVMLTAEAIGVTLNLKKVDLMAGEHLTPEFERLNPEKKVPLLIDDDYKLLESRAIMTYLVDEYGKNMRLYPKESNVRAMVNQQLYFDIGILYKAIADYYYPVVFKGAQEYSQTQYIKLKEAFQILDLMLEDHDYIVGRSMTVADLALIASVSTAEAFGFDPRRYRNVARWFNNVKSSAPGYRKANGEGLEMLKKMCGKNQ